MSTVEVYPNRETTMQSITKKTIFGVRLAVAALFIYWFVIFLGTHLPGSSLKGTPRINDKLIHFSLYAGLGFLLCYITTSERLFSRFSRIIAIGLAYGAVDEWSQGFVPGRTSDIRDFIANACGLLSAVIVYAICRHLYYCFKNRSQTQSRSSLQGRCETEQWVET